MCLDPWQELCPATVVSFLGNHWEGKYPLHKLSFSGPRENQNFIHPLVFQLQDADFVCSFKVEPVVGKRLKTPQVIWIYVCYIFWQGHVFLVQLKLFNGCCRSKQNQIYFQNPTAPLPSLAWLCSIHGALCCPLISSVISTACASISVCY